VRADLHRKKEVRKRKKEGRKRKEGLISGRSIAGRSRDDFPRRDASVRRLRRL